ncbi:MAG: hypothetical protein RRZ71_08630 [Clostridia bacterium]
MKSINVRTIIMIAIIAAAVVMSVIGYIILPVKLAMHIPNSTDYMATMPKPVGLVIPLAISVTFAVLYNKGESKNLLISLVGLLIFALTFIFNL